MTNTYKIQTDERFADAARQIVEVSHWLHGCGWSPATSSNYSIRLDNQSCAITVSGKHKGRLSLQDVMRVDLAGNALEDKKPSAETLLHTQLYQRDADIGAVLHTHSVTATLVSMSAPRVMRIKGLEILKAFAGIDSHEQEIALPVFDNTQDIASLAADVENAMQENGTGHAYLIRGHGVYTWGRSMDDAIRQLEALEFLLEYVWRSKGQESSLLTV